MSYRSKKILGMPVISLADGQVVGRVKRLLLDLENLTVAGIILDRKGWFKEQPVIPYHHVRNIGSHAVTIDEAAAVTKLSSQPELLELARKDLPLVGARVITEEGAVLGTVEDFFFAPQDGKIEHLKLKTGLWQSQALLPASYIRTLGRDCLIVKADSPGLIRQRKGISWPNREAAGVQRLGEEISRYIKRLPFLGERDKPGGPPEGPSA